MNRSPVAFLMLLGGLAIGTLIGFTVGSSQTQSAAATSIPSIEPTAAPGSSRAPLVRAEGDLGRRSSLQADFDALAPPGAVDSGPSGQLVARIVTETFAGSAAGIAAEAERNDAAAGAIDPAAGDDPSRTITGIVLDDRGQPLAGATVTTLKNPNDSIISTRSPDSIGQGWEGEDDLADSLRSQAASALTRRRQRRLAVSNEEGRFVLTQVSPGRHTLRTYLKGYVFGSRRAYAGGDTSVTGKPAELFHLEVVGADEAPLEEATIGVKDGRNWTYYEWRAEDPYLPLADRSAQLRAFAGGPLLGDKRRPFAALASDERRVHLDLDGEGPHRFVVKPTLSLCVTVVDRTADGPTLPHSVRYVSAEQLLAAGGRAQFSDSAKNISPSGDGRFRIGTLEAGDYVLGVSRGTLDPEVFTEFTIADGPVEELVELPPLRADDFWIVKAYAPSGAVLSGLTFSLWTENEGRINRSRLSSTERRAGEHWVPRYRDTSLSASPAKLITKSLAYGAMMTPVSRDQSNVRVDFAEPCELRVDVQADAEQTFDVTLQIDESLGGTAQRSLVYEGPKPVRGQGFVTFSGLQPGLAKLSLLTKDSGANSWRNDSQTLAIEEVALRSGTQVAAIAATALHTLTIYAPDEPEGTRFYASAIKGESGGELRGRASGKLGSDGTVQLEKLPAGRYELVVSRGLIPTIQVVVPSGTLTYRRPKTVGYRVSPRREGRELAPLVAGDIITQVNGDSVAVGALSSRIGLAVAEGGATLTLLRDGEPLEIAIERAPANARYTPIDSLE